MTMREIAKVAGCSHTTIYIYFRDKEDLLYQLSVGPLESLHQQMNALLFDKELLSDEKLKSLGRVFIEFCFAHRNMYTIFFMTSATRVDEQHPVSEINQLRVQLFGLLRHAVAEFLQIQQEETLAWAYARIYFFSLHGIFATYVNSEEPVEALMARLGPTFDLALEVMISGFLTTSKGTMKQNED